MREIKFRCWDCEHQEMICDERMDELTFVADAGQIRFLKLDTNGDELYLPQMQFTGFKDKHGHEIYDGDTVDVQYNRIGLVVVRWMPSGRWSISDYKISDCELRGNIYENPKGTRKTHKPHV